MALKFTDLSPRSVTVRASLRSDVAWGIRIGAFVAGVFSLWVIGLSIVRGTTQFEQYGMTTWGIVSTYFAAAAVAGAVVGLLRPWARTRGGAAAVGAVAGVIVYAAISVAMDGWRNFDPAFALVAGIPVGGICGYTVSQRRAMRLEQ